MYTIGVDIGGTSIKAGLVNNGEIVCRSIKETNRMGGLDELSSGVVSAYMKL